MNTREMNSTVFHQASHTTTENERGRPPVRRCVVLAAVVAAAGLVEVASASAQASHPPTHRDTATAPQVAIPSPTPGPAPSPTQQQATPTSSSSSSSFAGAGTTVTCFVTEPVTNENRADVLIIRLRRQLRRSDDTSTEWLVVDRATTGSASHAVPLYVKVHDQVFSADGLGAAAHATPTSVPEVTGAVEVPCQARTPVSIRWSARPYQGGVAQRAPLAV